jgi:ABC-type phosphate/phosphonate transport system permease subunit
VTAFIRSIPEPVLLFLRIFAVGVGQALFETITSRLFGDREVQSEGVV